MSSPEDHPLQSPPPGQISNFNDPESRGPTIVALCYIFISLMWPILLLRLYSKVWVLRKFWWDDASAVLAAVGVTVFAATLIWCIGMKILGPHAWNVRAVAFTDDVIRVITLESSVAVYSFTVLCAKLALFLLYYRLFAFNRRTKIAVYLGIIANCLFYVASAIFYLVLCLPRPGDSWTSTRFDAQCRPTIKMADPLAYFGLISDLYVFGLPLPILWRLQMPSRRKLGIMAIFLTGLTAIVVSSLSLYFRVSEMSNSDISWTEPPASGLAVVEATIGMICGSIPYLPALFHRHAPDFSRICRLLHGVLCNWRIRPKKGGIGGSGSETTMPQGAQVATHVLGSIQGEGNFITPGIFSRIWGTQCSTERSGSANILDGGGPTNRHYHKIPLNTEIVPPDAPSRTPGQSTENPAGMVSKTHSGNRSDASRKGYWDIISTFRSGNGDSTIRSESHPRSQPGHP